MWEFLLNKHTTKVSSWKSSEKQTTVKKYFWLNLFKLESFLICLK